MLGSATLTTVESSNTMLDPSTVVNTIHRPRAEANGTSGTPPPADGGTLGPTDGSRGGSTAPVMTPGSPPHLGNTTRPGPGPGACRTPRRV
ncbi:hypothetical protein GCM10010347_29740 [Streptomyces cirratus]|uniref:Uncharacterized protein n=1 Tax=Streptomyces cirratus TaxID=68187 RepID=A0ABQ3F062_9ACTN|nr:hypothetical protein GCM10010347_29740 [Streptomyces cirratus]